MTPEISTTCCARAATPPTLARPGAAVVVRVVDETPGEWRCHIKAVGVPAVIAEYLASRPSDHQLLDLQRWDQRIGRWRRLSKTEAELMRETVNQLTHHEDPE